MALTQPRATLSRHSGRWTYPVAAATKIWQGALIVLDAGYAKPGAAATGLIALGRAGETIDNTSGAAGALSVPVERGTYYFDNSAADPVTQADVGKTAYIVDDETVARSDGADSGANPAVAATRSPAGIIRAVDIHGVWVEID